MSYLTMKFPTNTTEITLKDDKGSVHKIDVTATLNSKLGPNSIGRAIIRLDGQLMTNTIELGSAKYPDSILNDADLEGDEKTELQDSILGDLEAERMLPSLEEIRDKIGLRGVEAEETAEQSLEDKELGLPSLSEIRKRL